MNTRERSSEKGQVVILLALLIMVLLGAAALAIDGSRVMVDRRNAQAAADASAIAGAYKAAQLTVTEAEIKTAAKQRALDNGYTITDDDIEFYLGATPMESYVRVVISTPTVPLLAKFVGFTGTITNQVEAVAKVNFKNAAQYAFIALSKGGIGLDLQQATIKICKTEPIPADCGGDIFVNSNLSGGAVSANNSSGQIQSDFNTYIVGTKDADAVITGGLYQNTPYVYNIPPSDNPPPVPTCGAESAKQTITEQTGPNGLKFTVYYAPGTISDPDFVKNAKTNVKLSNGVYCFPNGINFTNDALWGDKVTLYITPPIVTNPKSTNEVTMVGTNKVFISPPLTGTYEGLSMYVYTYNYDPAKYNYCTFKLNGGGNINLEGTIYIPMCTLDIGGSSDFILAAQLIAYKVNVSGSSNFNMKPKIGSNYSMPLPGSVDLSR